MLIRLLREDLSVIGPRPTEKHFVDLANAVWQQYFQVKPGLFNYAVLKLGNLGWRVGGNIKERGALDPKVDRSPEDNEL